MSVNLYNPSTQDFTEIASKVENVRDTSDILMTEEELLANTLSGKLADSLLVKQLNIKLDECVLERRTDGVYITYTPPGGADPVTKKLGEPEIKVVSKTTNYPTAGPNSEQTVTFSVEFDAIEGYQLAYAGITQMNTYNSNGSIRYVEFTNMQITENTVSWSVHTQRGTGGGTSSVVIQGVFIPV